MDQAVTRAVQVAYKTLHPLIDMVYKVQTVWILMQLTSKSTVNYWEFNGVKSGDFLYD